MPISSSSSSSSSSQHPAETATLDSSSNASWYTLNYSSAVTQYTAEKFRSIKAAANPPVYRHLLDPPLPRCSAHDRTLTVWLSPDTVSNPAWILPQVVTTAHWTCSHHRGRSSCWMEAFSVTDDRHGVFVNDNNSRRQRPTTTWPETEALATLAGCWTQESMLDCRTSTLITVPRNRPRHQHRHHHHTDDVNDRRHASAIAADRPHTALVTSGQQCRWPWVNTHSL